MNRFRDFSMGICFIVLSLAVVLVALPLRRAAMRADESLVNVRDAAGIVRAYAQAQTEDLRSERNRRAIEAGVAAAATAQASLRLINTQTIPRANRAIEQLSESARALGELTRHTDASLNEHLLPEAARLVSNLADSGAALQLTVRQAEAALRMIEATAQQSGVAIEDIRLTLAGPEMKQVMRHAAEATGEIRESLRRLPATADHLEAIFGQIERFSRETNRLRKAQILFSILSTLVPIVRAFY